MALITISRGSYTRGKEIAEKVAEILGYECISRDFVLEVSEELNIPEIKLVRALHDAPGILDRLTYKKEKYITYFQATFLRHMQKNNVVYHGLAGHFFLKDISHVFKVRIIADMEERVKLEMERENISRDAAYRILKKDDEERKKWSKYLYGIDTCNPHLYDLVINISEITVDDAVDNLCYATGFDQFQTTPESQKTMDDFALAAEVKAALVDTKPDIEVSSKDGRVFINTEVHISQEENLVKQFRRIGENISGVKAIEVHYHNITNYN